MNSSRRGATLSLRMGQILFFEKSSPRDLRDEMAKIRIAARLRQIESGNLGDSKPVGEGVTELRIHVGAGYRVYCGRHGQRWVILLCGGDKDSQPKDIARANTLCTS